MSSGVGLSKVLWALKINELYRGFKLFAQLSKWFVYKSTRRFGHHCTIVQLPHHHHRQESLIACSFSSTHVVDTFKGWNTWAIGDKLWFLSNHTLESDINSKEQSLKRIFYYCDNHGSNLFNNGIVTHGYSKINSQSHKRFHHSPNDFLESGSNLLENSISYLTIEMSSSLPTVVVLMLLEPAPQPTQYLPAED